MPSQPIRMSEVEVVPSAKCRVTSFSVSEIFVVFFPQVSVMLECFEMAARTPFSASPRVIRKAVKGGVPSPTPSGPRKLLSAIFTPE
jgi:hypothetical protein